MTYLALALVTALSIWLYRKPSLYYPLCEELYVCTEKGDTGELYVRRVRVVEYATVFEVEEFKRITCRKGASYLSAQSDWFKPVGGRCGEFTWTYEKLPPKAAKARLKEQWPTTVAVAKGIAKMKRAGNFKKASGFAA